MQDPKVILPDSDTPNEARESLAYIAGFFDGEGCVTVSVRQGKSTHHTIRVSVTNTRLDVLEYISILLPGSIYPYDSKDNRKLRYTLVWTGREAINTLELLLPYLRIKGEVAEVAVDMWYKCFDNRYRNPSGGPKSILSEAETILRSSYTKHIMNYNKRGR